MLIVLIRLERLTIGMILGRKFYFIYKILLENGIYVILKFNNFIKAIKMHLTGYILY
jgi:hypothetical protein